ncbi:MAG: RNA methyltransferase [Kiritimatiellae bacterium]|nr:RNA methyltransferase [Kiritimatiellia bacterium]MDD4622332.1 RNA methyltransferase [Kiritimatiellia bacterium]
MGEVLDNIRVVLVGTLYSGNVGSVCRAMANMGVSDLALAGPRICDGWQDAVKMAVHAGEILEKRREAVDLAEAVADCAFVVGTTARGGLYRQHVKTPRETAPELLSLAERGRVALVFGREDKGLTNEEIGMCTHLIRIPVHVGYTSLNLAQAVLLCCYELYAALGVYEPPCEKSLPASAGDKLKLTRLWREMLLLTGFMKEDKADHMMQGIQRIFSRGVYTGDDVAIMMGVARQAEWAARNGGGVKAKGSTAGGK